MVTPFLIGLSLQTSRQHLEAIKIYDQTIANAYLVKVNISLIQSEKCCIIY